jgi:hypothetical protein
VTAAPAALLALLAFHGATRGDPDAPARFAAGLGFALQQVTAGSGERDETRALGALGVWRPTRPLALALRYSGAAVNHRYDQIHFESTYHRLGLAPEGRLPLGPHFDFAASLGPEVTLLRSRLGDGSGVRARTRAFWGFAAGLGALYRWTRLEIRADLLVSRREGRTDLAVGGFLLYLIR